MSNFDISQIKLIVGLGNSEKEYIYTRHNAGFLFVDYIASNIFITAPKFKCLISETKLNENKATLIKPTTMMNSSGESVTLVKNFYKLKNKQILVVHDDLDLALGEFKIQFAKKPKIHNGINSVEEFLGGDDFWRLRIGIDSRTKEFRKQIAGSDYVLGRFSQEELDTLKSTFQKIVTELT